MPPIDKQYFNSLLKKYRLGQANSQEIKFLESFYDLFEGNEDLIEDDNQPSYLELKQQMKQKVDERIAQFASQPRSINKRSLYIRYAAAASVLALLSISFYFFWKPNKAPNITVAQATIKPGGNKAMLTLAGGQTIVLDQAAQGEVAQQAGIRIRKAANGMLVYETGADTTQVAASAGVTPQNTITTPRGGQYLVVLPDGSRVMLNAASSLTYPVRFQNKERVVQLQGEGYFEVAKNKKQPFMVRSAGQTVEVLGTHFNINAYGDEAAIKTTLLEGSVKVLAGNGAGVITPGQQCVVGRDGKLSTHEVDAEKEVAWKNGVFSFENDDLQSVMRQVGRWYDVEVRYQGALTSQRFYGEIPRSSKLTDVFKILEVNNVHFVVNGKTVTVSYKPAP